MANTKKKATTNAKKKVTTKKIINEDKKVTTAKSTSKKKTSIRKSTPKANIENKVTTKKKSEKKIIEPVINLEEKKEIIKENNSNLFTIIIFIIVILLLVITGILIYFTKHKKKNYDDVIQKLCVATMNKKYGDIVDIVYFPKSDFITEEGLNEFKVLYTQDMLNYNVAQNVKTCTFEKTKEDDDIVTYEVFLGDNNSELVECDKKTGKLLFDGFYSVNTLKTKVKINLKINGKLVKPMETSEDGETYEVALLEYLNYDIKVTPREGVSDQMINELINKYTNDNIKIELVDKKIDFENSTEVITLKHKDKDSDKEHLVEYKYYFDNNIYEWIIDNNTIETNN